MVNGYRTIHFIYWVGVWNMLDLLIIIPIMVLNIQDFGQNEKGHLLLQDHGDFVMFKNIKIREL